jgi:hypothetical protein
MEYSESPAADELSCVFHEGARLAQLPSNTSLPPALDHYLADLGSTFNTTFTSVSPALNRFTLTTEANTPSANPTASQCPTFATGSVAPSVRLTLHRL